MQNMVGPDYLSLALAEPSRRALLENLRFGQKSVTELVTATQLKQPNVSNHLSKMRLQGIVRAERIGRQVYYSLAMPFADVLLRMHELAAPPARAGEHQAGEEATAAGHEQEHRNAHSASDPTSEALVRLSSRPGPFTHSTLEEWQEIYFQTIFEGREDRASELVNTMLSQRMEMEAIYEKIFQPCLNRVGDLFQQGLTDEAHEHMASAITERMMMRVAHFHSPVLRDSHRAVLGCVVGNWHMIGLRMLADGLRSLGWETIFLGANMPTESFAAVVGSMQPDLVVISCALKDQIADLEQLLARLRLQQAQEGARPFLIAVGGHALLNDPVRSPLMPEDLTADNLTDFLEIVTRHFPKDSGPMKRVMADGVPAPTAQAPPFRLKQGSETGLMSVEK